MTAGTIICELEAGGLILPALFFPAATWPLDQWTSPMVPGVTEQQHGLIKAPFDGVIASVDAGIEAT